MQTCDDAFNPAITIYPMVRQKLSCTDQVVTQLKGATSAVKTFASFAFLPDVILQREAITMRADVLHSDSSHSVDWCDGSQCFSAGFPVLCFASHFSHYMSR